MSINQVIDSSIFVPEAASSMKIDGKNKIEWDILEGASEASKNKKYGVNWSKIIHDIKNVEHLLDYSIDPRAKHHLDTTKLSYHQERVEAWANNEKVAPLTIDMALTQKCGYACTYCYAGLQLNPAAPADWQTYENFLDDCVEIGHKPNEGVKAISLVSDGESSLNPYFYDFVKKGYENGMDMATATNGQVVDHNRLEELLAQLTYIRFNFSGGEPQAYAEIMGTEEKYFHIVCDNIKESVRIKRENNLNVTIGLQMVLLPQYADQVIPLAILGRDLGVDYTVIKHCSDDEKGRLGVDYSWYKTREAIELLYAAEALSTENYSVQAKWSKLETGRDRKYSKCFGPSLFLQMSGTCLVAPCGSLFHSDYKKFHIGNYAKDRFRDIWASEKYWSVMGTLGSDKFDPRVRCATLCLQDKVNEVLFDLKENNIPLPKKHLGQQPEHVNFI